MSVNSQSLAADVALPELFRRTKRLSILMIVMIFLFLVSTAALGFLFWKKAKALDEAQKTLAFSQWVTDYNSTTDFVVPQVNTIQFLRKGYSISFDSVNYTQEGLALSGTIGNGTELYLNSLAVNFSARPYPYQIKEKWQKQNFPWWSDEWNIGSGQTNVGTLNPGSSATFRVTIPNVKQTSESIEIAVVFSGERYSYLK